MDDFTELLRVVRVVELLVDDIADVVVMLLGLLKLPADEDVDDVVDNTEELVEVPVEVLEEILLDMLELVVLVELSVELELLETLLVTEEVINVVVELLAVDDTRELVGELATLVADTAALVVMLAEEVVESAVESVVEVKRLVVLLLLVEVATLNVERVLELINALVEVDVLEDTATGPCTFGAAATAVLLYMFSLLGPPQISDEFPAHCMLQLSVAGAEPVAITLPQ